MKASAKEARKARVRQRWTPPDGPLPTGPGNSPDLHPSDEETLDHLAGEWRIFQRRRGHRWSTDDLLAAWYGCRLAADRGVEVRRHLDLGAGIGSVAMLVAWKHPECLTVAIEAQTTSADLFRRSVRYNGATDRIDVRTGDLRDPASVPEGAVFDLVTGSPPYLTTGEATVSEVPQRAACRFELRGGLDGYLGAMARTLASGGVGSLVHHDAAAQRLSDTAAACDLSVVRRRTIVFVEGRTPLIAVYGLQHRRSAGEGTEVQPPLVIRTADGGRGAQWSEARQWMGYPP